MRQKILRPLAIATLLLGFAAPVQAADDDEPGPDARLQGYQGADGKPEKVALPASGNAGTWAMFVIMTVICMGVMFKNGKRTHLD